MIDRVDIILLTAILTLPYTTVYILLCLGKPLGHTRHSHPSKDLHQSIQSAKPGDSPPVSYVRTVRTNFNKKTCSKMIFFYVFY